jgi:hypothetical protein
MIAHVADTSVLVDLERAGLLEMAFGCGLTMIVPDLLYERELAEHNGPYLRTLGLGVVALAPHEVQLAQDIKRGRTGLSWPDTFALACAHRPGHVLVSGDKTLRSEATKRLSTVVELLWVLDRMDKSGVVEQNRLHAALSTIVAHPTCRLPRDEVAARLAKWHGSRSNLVDGGNHRRPARVATSTHTASVRMQPLTIICQ